MNDVYVDKYSYIDVMSDIPCHQHPLTICTFASCVLFPWVLNIDPIFDCDMAMPETFLMFGISGDG